MGTRGVCEAPRNEGLCTVDPRIGPLAELLRAAAMAFDEYETDRQLYAEDDGPEGLIGCPPVERPEWYAEYMLNNGLVSIVEPAQFSSERDIRMDSIQLDG